MHLWDGVRVEDDVFIGPNVSFCNNKYPKSKNKNFKCEAVVIKKGASIGANVTILPGVTIGENAIVAAGSVAIKDILANTKYIPANSMEFLGGGYIYPLITRILNVLHIESELYAKYKIHL